MNTYVDNSENKYYNKIIMKEKNTGTDNLNAEDLFAAMKEKNISAENLAAELKPLLDDYFTCVCAVGGKNITLTFLNGQKFRISIKRLKR